MLLWRLYRQAHGPGLDGAGGLHAAGRWHELGSPVVYFGASAAIVVLEKLAHINPDALPTDLILTRFEAEVIELESRDAANEPNRLCKVASLLGPIQPALLVINGDLVLENFLDDHLEVGHRNLVGLDRGRTVRGEIAIQARRVNQLRAGEPLRVEVVVVGDRWVGLA